MDSFSIGFSARGIADEPSEWKRIRRRRARDRQRDDEATGKRGWGFGININIIALIALDRGGAGAYDTLQITRGDGTQRGGGGGGGGVVQRAREDAKRSEEGRAGWLCR